jgi:hypothetical protein
VLLLILVSENEPYPYRLTEYISQWWLYDHHRVVDAGISAVHEDILGRRCAIAPRVENREHGLDYVGSTWSIEPNVQQPERHPRHIRHVASADELH